MTSITIDLDGLPWSLRRPDVRSRPVPWGTLALIAHPDFVHGPARHSSSVDWRGCSFEGRPAPEAAFPRPHRHVAVAWACCESDPGAGLPFARSILEADEGDDAPALIACDWLEETGAAGLLAADDAGRLLAEHRARQRTLLAAGPLHARARRMIGSMCPGCGFPKAARRGLPSAAPRCDWCGLRSSGRPPIVAIPRAIPGPGVTWT